MKPKQLFRRDPFLKMVTFRHTVEEQLSLVYLYSTLLRDDSRCHIKIKSMTSYISYVIKLKTETGLAKR